MRTIYGYLRDYLKEHFNFSLYFFTTLFVAFLLYFNFSLDFEDSVIDSYTGKFIRVPMFFLFQGIPYFIVCLFIYLFTENKDFFKKRGFWLLSTFGFIVLGFDRGSSFHFDLAHKVSTPFTYNFIRRLIENFSPIFTVVLPLYIVYRLFLKKKIGHFFGVTLKGANLRPYWVMLLIMAPLIALASFQPDFLQEYPNYKRAGIEGFVRKTGWSQNLAIAVHEMGYGFGFFIVEIVFRGFFIFAMVKYLGKDVVLPMAVTYCVLHFGKPLGEAISSYFGGYLLGLIALRTENIYGGIVVHLGIAMMMELAAFLQYL